MVVVFGSNGLEEITSVVHGKRLVNGREYQVIVPTATWRLKPYAPHLTLAANPVMAQIFAAKLVVYGASAGSTLKGLQYSIQA